MRKFAIFIFGLSLLAYSATLSVAAAQTPVSFVRRAEALMILLKNAGVEVDKNAQTNGVYPDILDGEWYVPYVIKGLEMDMVDVERETGLVHPHRSVTRAEFLKMMTKAFDLTTDIPYQYNDIPEQAWYTKYVGLSWRYSLFRGVGDANTLQPERRMTHSEATAVIYKLLTAEPSLQPTPNMFPVAAEPPPEKKAGFLQTIIDALRPRTTQVEPQQSPATGSDPDLVKNTMLKLIRSRKNQAQYTKNELIDAVNDVRAAYNLDPVRSNYHLDLAAKRHAKDMADRGYFSHYTPEGLSYVDRIRGAGYLNVNIADCTCPLRFTLDENRQSPNYLSEPQSCEACEPAFSVGENLAKGQLSVEQVLEDWLNSPNHRKNILRPQFTEMGVGLFGDLWVQTFGNVELP